MRTRYVLILLGLLVTVAACTSATTTGIPPQEAFCEGEQGVALNFIAQAPPAEVTDQDFPFKVIVNAENIGEHHIDPADVEIRLRGFLPDDFGRSTTDMTKDLATVGQFGGDAKFLGVRRVDGECIQGEQYQFEFPETGSSENFEFNRVIQGNQVFPVRATACYQYATKVITDYCILEDMLRPRDNPLCEPSSGRGVSNSAAPIKVTSVRQSVAGTNKILLNFDVSQVGSGEIFLGTDADHCDTSFSNRNRISVLVDPNDGLPDASSSTLRCPGLIGFTSQTKTGQLLLDEGSAKFTCIIETPEAESVPALDLELSYYVEESVETSLLVKHVNIFEG